MKRNQKRKEDFLAKKAASAEVKKEVIPKSIEKATSQILFCDRKFKPITKAENNLSEQTLENCWELPKSK